MKEWCVMFDGSFMHVYPHDDGKVHSMTDACWCNPELADDCGVYTHHSLDRREKYEEAGVQ